MPPFDQVAIVGVGLLGGSIAGAIKHRGLARQVTGAGRDPEKLRNATTAGLIDHGTTSLSEAVGHASLVVVCTPVERVPEAVVEVLGHAPEDCLVTDVASTKEQIVQHVVGQAAPDRLPRFVPSHPLAGDHRSGAEFARADLLVGRTVVVTPLEQNPASAVEAIGDFWQSLGANVLRMTPALHDAAVAQTSHLPHLVASALAASTPPEMLPLAATGWADTTRIAAADAALWRQIFLSNRPQVLAALERFERRLAHLRAALAGGEDQQLEQLLTEGKQTRDAVGN